MKKIDFGQVIGILANLGVIAGIVFLGIELSQNNRLMESQASYNLLQNSVGGIELITTDDELALAVYKDINGQELSEIEVFLLRLQYSGTLQKWLWEFRQSENGLISENDLPVATWIATLNSRPVMLSIFRDEQFQELFPEDFVEFLAEHGAER